MASGLVGDFMSHVEEELRRRWMAALARASASDVADTVVAMGEPDGVVVMKGPEAGSIMLQTRAGGTGRRFNFGEATMSRCVVRLASGTMGFGYALGRDIGKVRDAAIIDAVMQDLDDPAGGFDRFIAPLVAKHEEADRSAAKEAAKTKVEFFTLVRGHS